MHDTDSSSGNTLPYEVKINLNVLSMLMLNRVGGHVDEADVVTVNQGGATWWNMKFQQQLSLGTRPRDCCDV